MAIFLDDTEIDLRSGRFLDGTYSLRLDRTPAEAAITWLYAGEHELPALYYIARHLNDQGCKPLILKMPYIPNARLDRVRFYEEVFTLKYFADIINSLGFDRVDVLDPHSNVACALINRVNAMYPVGLIRTAITDIKSRGFDNPLLYYPDEGAVKRYSTRITAPYAFGIKKRDWVTGGITALEIHGESPSGRNILMVDDICSRGDTLLRSAMALSGAGASNIYVFVTHCENAILDSQLLRCESVQHIYTTNSIYTGYSDKITTYNATDEFYESI